MSFAYDNAALEQKLTSARSIDETEEALIGISRLVRSFRDPSIYGQRLFSPGLDVALSKLPARLALGDVRLERSNENVCVVATQFYAYGGHSRVASDIMNLIGADRTTLILTHAYGGARYRDLLSREPETLPLPRRSTIVLSAPTLGEKIIELYMLLAAIRPGRIFVLGHHMDPVSVAGCWGFRGVVDFIHHADHLPCLGATLPFGAHVDLTYTCHLVCRDARLDPIYAGMSVLSRPERAASRAQDGRLRLATCGSLHKYRKPAAYRWTDYVAAALTAREAEMVHFGPVNEDFVNEVRQALSSAGVSPDRYVFAGACASLPQAIADGGIDVYLSSYPETGARANLEAMVAGAPAIVPIEPALGPLLRYSSPLPAWLPVFGPDELPQALARACSMVGEVRSPSMQTRIIGELSRFEDYVFGRPVTPAPPLPAAARPATM